MRNQAAVALLCPEIAMNPIAISEASREGHLYLLILDLDNRFFDFVAAAMRMLNTGNCIDLTCFAWRAVLLELERGQWLLDNPLRSFETLEW